MRLGLLFFFARYLPGSFAEIRVERDARWRRWMLQHKTTYLRICGSSFRSDQRGRPKSLRRLHRPVVEGAEVGFGQVSGGYIGGVPPVPIPNTEVKPSRADGTAWFPCGRVGRCRNLIAREETASSCKRRPAAPGLTARAAGRRLFC